MNPFSFEGELNRGKYIQHYLLANLAFLFSYFLIEMGALASSRGLGDYAQPSPVGGSFLTLIGLVGLVASTWIILSSTAKRWRAQGESPQLTLLNFIPFVNLFMFLYLCFTPVPEKKDG